MNADLPLARRMRALLVAILLAALGYAAFMLWAGWSAVQQAALQVGAAGMALALTGSLLNYGARFLRWQRYLGALGYAVPLGRSMAIYVAGFAFTPTPGKAGELARGWFLRRHGVSLHGAGAAFLSERLSDLLAIVGLALLGLWTWPQARGVLWTGGAALALALAAGIWAMRQPLPERPGLWYWALGALQQTRHCHRPMDWLLATALSFVGWSAEGWAFYVVLDGMGWPLSGPLAAGIFAAGMLAGALSFLPGGLGGAEAVMVGLLVATGAPPALAVAATVLIRLTTLWFAVLLGWGALVWLRRAP